MCVSVDFEYDHNPLPLYRRVEFPNHCIQVASECARNDITNGVHRESHAAKETPQHQQKRKENEQMYEKKQRPLAGMGTTLQRESEPLPTTGRLRSRRNYAIRLLTRAAIKAKLSARHARIRVALRNLHNTRHCLHSVSP